MHIPDGFLDAKTWLTCGAVAAGGVIVAARKTQQELGERTVPLMGVMSAFVFAAQMINFPVAAGTSGHLLGSMLAAVLLGPWAGATVLTLVLVVQCFIFQDGGVTALGANIVNMALLGLLCGYATYRIAVRALGVRGGFYVGAALGAWVSVVVGAIACAAELGVSGTVPLPLALATMTGIHSIIGIGEAVITVLVLSLVRRVRPDLIYGSAAWHEAAK